MAKKTTDCICNDDTLTAAEKWEQIHGTTANGNLPQWKRDEHVGHKWYPCPYSTQASEHFTRAKLGLNNGEALPTKTDHTNSTTGKVHYMGVDGRSGWGYVCTFDDCNYYLTNGVRYFRR